MTSGEGLSKTAIGNTVSSIWKVTLSFCFQTESPLLVQPYLPHVTRSELHAIMTAGFATIAGSVLGAYISFGVRMFGIQLSKSDLLLLYCFFSFPVADGKWHQESFPLVSVTKVAAVALVFEHSDPKETDVFTSILLPPSCNYINHYKVKLYDKVILPKNFNLGETQNPLLTSAKTV